MPDREKIIRIIDELIFEAQKEPKWKAENALRCLKKELLKEQETVKPKTIPEELKLKMWNALYAAEDKFEEKYVGTKEHNSWFLVYRPWLQEGFNLAIKAIADWEGR